MGSESIRRAEVVEPFLYILRSELMPSAAEFGENVTSKKWRTIYLFLKALEKDY